MHDYKIGDKVSFIDIYKQTKEGIIQDLLMAGGNYAYSIEEYDFLVLEKNITARLVKAEKKKTDYRRPK